MAVSVPAPRDTVYALLVSLAGEARGLGTGPRRQRLVEAVGWHYGATLVTLHLDDGGWPDALSDPRGVLAHLPRLARARVETLDARLVRAALAGNAPVSALDLDPGLEGDQVLREALGVSDVFALPLRAAGRCVGVLALYLPLASRALGEADLEALSGVGEILTLPEPTGLPASASAPRGLLRRLFG